jgi:hypothetical protein
MSKKLNSIFNNLCKNLLFDNEHINFGLQITNENYRLKYIEQL